MCDTEQDAIRKTRTAGLVPEIVRQTSKEPAGTVILQSHDFDHPMHRGDVLLITVSSGPEKQSVPALVGGSTEAAKEAVERIGLTLMITKKVMNAQDAGTVLSQQPEAGEMLEYGGIVQVVVSGGEVTVPSLEGEVLTQQLPRLERLGLLSRVLSTVVVEDIAQDGRVATQSPKAGEKVMAGSVIDVVLYQAPGDSEP